MNDDWPWLTRVKHTWQHWRACKWFRRRQSASWRNGWEWMWRRLERRWRRVLRRAKGRPWASWYGRSRARRGWHRWSQWHTLHRWWSPPASCEGVPWGARIRSKPCNSSMWLGMALLSTAPLILSSIFGQKLACMCIFFHFNFNNASILREKKNYGVTVVSNNLLVLYIVNYLKNYTNHRL